MNRRGFLRGALAAAIALELAPRAEQPLTFKGVPIVFDGYDPESCHSWWSGVDDGHVYLVGDRELAELMERTWLECVKNAEQPDLIFANGQMYELIGKRWRAQS